MCSPGGWVSLILGREGGARGEGEREGGEGSGGGGGGGRTGTILFLIIMLSNTVVKPS